MELGTIDFHLYVSQVKSVKDRQKRSTIFSSIDDTFSC